MEDSYPAPAQTGINKDQALPSTDNEVKDTSPLREEVPDPETLFFQGCEDLKSNLFEIAVERLCKSLEIMTAKKGELDVDLYKYYFHYADALLRQYEAKQDLFGDEIPTAVVYSDEEMENTEETNPVQSEAESQDESSSDESESDPAQNSTLKNENGDENTAKEETEEPEDLQLAWESLETCRVILNLNQNDLHYLFLAYSRLGDLQTWKESFEEACNEYQEALNILFRLEGEEPSRRKAELFFLIGTTFLNQPGKERDAQQNITLALNQLENLRSLACNPQEIEELSSLIAEIKLKSEDAIEQEQSLIALKTESQSNPEDFGIPTIQGEVQDLGVLGKRRREENNDENTDPNEIISNENKRLGN